MASKKKSTAKKAVKAAKKATVKKSAAKTFKKPAAKTVKKVAKKVLKKAVSKIAKTVKKAVKKTAPKKALAKKAKATPAKKPAFLAPVKMATPVAVKKAVNIDYSKAITPLADRLVVRALQGERVTSGGIIIPDSASTATGYIKGEVLAVGSGAKTKKGHIKALDVQKGDKVLFSEYAGTKVQFNSEELQIINETDVMGIIEG